MIYLLIFLYVLAGIGFYGAIPTDVTRSDLTKEPTNADVLAFVVILIIWPILAVIMLFRALFGSLFDP